MRVAVLSAAVCVSIAGVSLADDVRASVKTFLQIPAGTLDAALNTLATQRGFQIVYITENLEGVRTGGVKGELTSEQALNELLTGTGFAFRYLDDNTVTVVPAPVTVTHADAGTSSSMSSTENTYPPNGAPLPEIALVAPEPRYVAPTRRDRIGRIWAPVMIDGKGPFRLALDTAASRSGVTASVAATLDRPRDESPQLMLRGTTGSASVPSIRVRSLVVGDLTLTPATLPIVDDPLGGAEGVLGTEGLADKRIYIDFQHDSIAITHSRLQRAAADFKTIPMQPSSLGLIVVSLKVGDVAAKGVIDTGSQVTVGNSAMLDALRTHQRGDGLTERIEGVTSDVQTGQAFDVPTILLGTLGIRDARAIYGDMRIFEAWKMTKDPVLLIGMDTIGQLDAVVIDYRLRELQLRLRPRDRRPVFPN